MPNPVKIRSAELNKRITIQRYVKVENDRGVNLHDYPVDKEIRDICASIEPFAAFIRNGVADKVAEVQFRITVRFREGLTLRDRIIYQGRVFEQILPPVDVNEQHRFLQLTCKELVNAHGHV